jgi:type II secretory ATPase GspE/PulE/Tfp pilus assembly ATPase PilB-like protein
LIASALNLIVAQRLARRLCVECRESYQAAHEEPELQPGTTLWRPVGCNACGRSGYRGRVALYEFLPVRGELRALVEDSTETIFAAAIRNRLA